MATSKEILSCAANEVGIVEKYNNNVKYNTWYYGREVSGSEYPWCLVFVDWIFNQCNASALLYDGKKTALCQTMADWFKQKGYWHTVSPQPGDLVFFKFGTNSRYTDHVGLVESVNSDGSVNTIEGNTSTNNQNNGGMVMRRTRKSGIVGYGRPKYLEQNNVVSSKRDYLYKGIDVSAAQTNMNYAKLKAAGLDFAIVKIIRKDLNPDQMFETHYKGFTSVGVPIFCGYNYSYATTVEKAKTDAQAVLKTLNGRRIAVCLDVEDDVQKNLGIILIDIINAYEEEISSAGLPFILYTGMSFYNTYIKPYSSKLRSRNIWMARYYKGDTPFSFTEDPNQSYKPMPELIGWQYTSKGRMDGYSKDLDFDVIYQDINAPDRKIITTVQTKGSKLNVRNAPKTGTVIDKLPNGSTVEVRDIDYATGWYVIGDSQYVSFDYIKSNTRGQISTGALNIRDKDSTAGKVVGNYHMNDVVEILKQSTSGWYLTPKGWISNKYVKL